MTGAATVDVTDPILTDPPGTLDERQRADGVKHHPSHAGRINLDTCPRCGAFALIPQGPQAPDGSRLWWCNTEENGCGQHTRRTHFFYDT